MSLKLDDFPDEILFEICRNMGPVDLGRCLRLCHSFNKVASIDDLWKVHCRCIYAQQKGPEECYFQVNAILQSNQQSTIKITHVWGNLDIHL